MQALRLTGTVAELHAREPFPPGEPVEPAVWWCDFTDPAIVLGSSQPDDVLDERAVGAAGVSVVRRRSGGGAVLLRPGAVVWIDLIVPAGEWPADVRASMIAAGRLWHDALVAVGALAPGAATVHDGGMVTTDWSATVCFAGFGPGEVLLPASHGWRKLVGLSQRRTRAGARIQGQVHVAPLVDATADLIVPDRRAAGRPPEAALAEVGAEPLAEALAEALAYQISAA